MTTNVLARPQTARVLTMLCPPIEAVQARVKHNEMHQAGLYLQFPMDQSGGDSLPVKPFSTERLDDRFYEIIGMAYDGWQARGTYDTKNNTCLFQLHAAPRWVPVNFEAKSARKVGWLARIMAKLKSIFGR